MKPYYDEDGIAIYHGRCEDVLPSLRGDMVATDPPYGIGVNYGAGFDDNRPDYWPWLRQQIETARTVAPVVALTHRVAALAEIHGWDWIGVWNKPRSFAAAVGNSPLKPHWEPIFLYGIHSLGTRTGKALSDVLTVEPVRMATGGKRGVNSGGWQTGEGGRHPTPKPVPLFIRLIDVLCPDGGTVIDPFMGSGTTLVAAKTTGRRAIGIEVEERHCEEAARRLRQGVLNFGAAS